MSPIEPAPSESLFRTRLPCSVGSSARPRAHTASVTPSVARFADERHGVSVHVPAAPPRARKSFRMQWH